MPIIDVLRKRVTQRAFDKTPLPQNHIDIILEAACSGPTKQRMYPYRIIALTNSINGLRLKNEIFLNSFINIPVKKHLLTAKAPLLLVWVGIMLPDNRNMKILNNNNTLREVSKSFDISKLSDNELKVIKDRVQIDCIISSTLALVTAEDLGYKTAFTACFDPEQATRILNLNSNEFPCIFLSVGKYIDVSKMQRMPVIKNGVAIGFTDPRSFSEPPKLTKDDLTSQI